jgi:hypothetical protein
MKIGYGYRRDCQPLRDAGADRCYIDGKNTERMERMDCIRDLREGDVLILLTLADLGAPKERQNLQAEIERRGASIEILGIEARKREGKEAFNPTPEQAKKIAMLWHDVTVPGPYALRRAAEIYKGDVSRNALNYRFGTRTKPKTKERS